MSKCPHCGYGDESSWQECPACGQYAEPAPGGPGASPPPGQGAYPPPGQGAYPPPGQGAYPPPGGDNPYAAPTAAGPPPGAYAYAYPQPNMLPTSGKAIASLVIGICSIVLYFLGFILGPLAIGLWASARNDFKQMPPSHKGQGLATAGLVTGIIGTLIGLFMVVIIIFALFMASQAPHQSPKF